ncbi:MAG: glycosyl hydrolase [Bacteroidota bacterium]
MKRQTKSIAIICIGLLSVAGLIGFKPFSLNEQVSKIEPVTAHRASDFLNSIGVNSAISTRGESLKKTIEITKYLGIRWIRSGYEGGVPIADLIAVHQQAGVRFSYGLLSGGTDIPKLLNGGRELAGAGALLALEGLNEPNNWGITYQDEKGGKELSWLAVAKVQRDLYAAVKKDEALKKYPVWSLSENGAQTDNTGLQYLEIPKGVETTMPEGTKYADFANCHNYFMHPSHPGLYDNQTWNAADPGPLCKVDGLNGNYGMTWKAKFKGYQGAALENLPRVTTETGATIGGELTEEKQARMFLNLYLAQFARGWSYTALYLLRDRSDEAGNQTFGFYKPDYTPRKSALYMHNMTAILADSPGDQSNVSANKSGKLSYSIAKLPETAHHLLLQKSNGRFALVVWSEKVSGADEIKINFEKALSSAEIYDPTLSASPVSTLKNSNAVTLTLSDHPMIIEI